MKILFACTQSLLDTTSGAAISVRSLLGGLFEYGIHSEAVTASIFDPPREVSLESMLPGQQSAVRDQQKTVEVWTGPLRHTILRTASSRRMALAPEEEEALIALVESRIQETRPDLLLTYGRLPAERKIRSLARRHGVPVVFRLANCTYDKAEVFSDVDLILVPSKFSSEFYRDRLGIRTRVLYPFISRDHCLALSPKHSELSTQDRPFDSAQDRRFVTFINPSPQKGLALFVRLVQEAGRLFPELPFLAVEGRWTKLELIRAGFWLEKLPNLTFVRNQANMRQVYGATRILLCPSYWLEGFGGVTVEAQMNGIPVLASRRGGIPEALNGGGFLLEVPDGVPEGLSDAKELYEMAMRRSRLGPMIPSAEQVRPWIEQVRILLENREVYEEAQRRAYKAAEKFSPERTLQAAADLFNEFVRGCLKRTEPPVLVESGQQLF